MPWGNPPGAETGLESDVSLSPTVDMGVGSALLGSWVAGKARGCGGKESRGELVTPRWGHLPRKQENVINVRVPTGRPPTPAKESVTRGDTVGEGEVPCSSSAHASQRGISLLSHPQWVLAREELPRRELGEGKGRTSSPLATAGVICTHHLLRPHHNIIIPTD